MKKTPKPAAKLKAVPNVKQPEARKLEAEFKLIQGAPGVSFPTYEEQKAALDMLLATIGKSAGMLEAAGMKHENHLTVFDLQAICANATILLSEGLMLSLQKVTAGNLSIGAAGSGAQTLFNTAKQMGVLFNSIFSPIEAAKAQAAEQTKPVPGPEVPKQDPKPVTDKVG